MFGGTNDNLEEIKKIDPTEVAGIKLFLGSSTGKMLIDNLNSIETIFSSTTLPISAHCEDEQTIKNNSNIPVILFPGNAMQINKNADGILFLSLISGRNPELLIGKQVISAPILKQASLEVISTGYMLIDSGRPTTASYMSNTLPIPRNKNGIATSTAMAGEYLGMKLIYMDGGSGAKKPIEIDMIKQVSKQINIPLIIGGGICNAQKAIDNCNAGADLIVVGNAIEKNADLILEISKAVHSV